MLIIISTDGDVYTNPDSVEIVECPWDPSEKHFAVFNPCNPDGKIISEEIPEGMEDKAKRELRTSIHFGMFQPNIVVDIKDVMHHLEA